MKINIEEINNINTISELNDYRTAINEACDNRMCYISNCLEANDMSNGTFYEIKENFESLAPILFKTQNGKKIINKYKNTVKENKNLSSLYTLYENIRKANKDVDVDFFTNMIMSKQWVKNYKTLDEDVKKLGNVLAEGFLEAGVKPEIDKTKRRLDEAINYVVENRLTNKNMAEYGSAIKIIKNHILENENKTFSLCSVADVDDYANSLLEEFNSKYANEDLSEDDVNIIKRICESQDNEKLFNEYKNECKTILETAKTEFNHNGDSVSSDKVCNLIEKINNKTFNKDTLLEDVVSLIGISKIFEQK